MEKASIGSLAMAAACFSTICYVTMTSRLDESAASTRADDQTRLEKTAENCAPMTPTPLPAATPVLSEYHHPGGDDLRGSQACTAEGSERYEAAR